MKKCVSILVGVLAVIVAAAAVLVALDRFRVDKPASNPGV